MNGTSGIIAIAGLASVLFAAGAGNADAAEVKEFRLGSARVWAIADSTGDRDMGVFQADPELIKKYAPTGKSPSGVMTYAVNAGGKTILIDTGHGNAASQLLPGLAGAGFKPEDIDAVLITHMHGDHVGGLFRDGEAAFPKARILIGDMEYAFWTDENSRAEFPDRKANFDMARTVKDVYGSAVGVFAFGDEVVPGITAMDSRGHTPGHVAFMLEFDGEKLLCIGDLVHAAALQFPHPEVNARYDMIPEQARETRSKYMATAAGERIPVAGMHLPFPGIGRVKAAGEAQFLYEPGY